MWKRIPQDKKKHILVGFALGIIFPAFFLWLLPLGLLWVMVISFSGVAIVGFGFELFSLFTGHGHAELMDGVATLLGGFLGCLVFIAGFAMVWG